MIPARALGRWATRAASFANRLQGIGTGGARGADGEAEAVANCLPASGAVVIDAGAHAGEFARRLLALAGNRIGKMLLIEPAEVHRLALATLKDDRCVHVPCALGDKNGRAMLFSDKEGSGCASLHNRRLEHFGMTFRPQKEVEVCTLDSLLPRLGVEKVDFLKMDIEGHELAALRGASDFLANRRIRALSFEFGGCNIDSRTYFQDFWYALRQTGFRLFRILPAGTLLEIEKYSESLEAFATTNYVAVLESDSR
jgi:FkbM family methyltransferase